VCGGRAVGTKHGMLYILLVVLLVLLIIGVARAVL
jgi:hypothetical protein